jgi:hypothetical protein
MQGGERRVQDGMIAHRDGGHAQMFRAVDDSRAGCENEGGDDGDKEAVVAVKNVQRVALLDVSHNDVWWSRIIWRIHYTICISAFRINSWETDVLGVNRR